MRSLLRWAGSKRQLLGNLKQYWNASEERRYVEPFAGSAALFFDLKPKKAIINDVNKQLIGFYRAIKKSPEQLYQIATSLSPDEKTYYKIREAYAVEPEPIKRGAYFFYLNRYCFNGIYRTNLAGKFNVPFAASKTGALPSWGEIEKAVQQLRKASTSTEDFEHLIDSKIEKNDFVYLDPPYAVENERVFKQYNATTFGLTDLERLKASLSTIDKRGAKFVLSYADCPEALEAFSDWHHQEVSCQRNVAGFAHHRRKATELMFSNIKV